MEIVVRVEKTSGPPASRLTKAQLIQRLREAEEMIVVAKAENSRLSRELRVSQSQLREERRQVDRQSGSLAAWERAHGCAVGALAGGDVDVADVNYWLKSEDDG